MAMSRHNIEDNLAFHSDWIPRFRDCVYVEPRVMLLYMNII